MTHGRRPNPIGMFAGLVVAVIIAIPLTLLVPMSSVVAFTVGLILGAGLSWIGAHR